MGSFSLHGFVWALEVFPQGPRGGQVLMVPVVLVVPMVPVVPAVMFPRQFPRRVPQVATEQGGQCAASSLPGGAKDALAASAG
ncbi:hypothetical protein E2C01_003055 [Portunus trituberculatus]|uniref:Uncharacterized protein n=1 Tax=Portunus trituberculatus TaxID=210409 RepID=A0A5B7CLJ5_PORTR|nr:hypothetical protein [Portunus trituberculatus]